MYYDYQCQDCNELFEIRHSMDYKGLVQCPICNSYNTNKLVIVPAIVFNWKDSSTIHKDLGDIIGTRYRPAPKRKDANKNRRGSGFVET